MRFSINSTKDNVLFFSEQQNQNKIKANNQM